MFKFKKNRVMEKRLKKKSGRRKNTPLIKILISTSTPGGWPSSSSSSSTTSTVLSASTSYCYCCCCSSSSSGRHTAMPQVCRDDRASSAVVLITVFKFLLSLQASLSPSSAASSHKLISQRKLCHLPFSNPSPSLYNCLQKFHSL